MQNRKQSNLRSKRDLFGGDLYIKRELVFFMLTMGPIIEIGMPDNRAHC